jgi:hypothetical protein
MRYVRLNEKQIWKNEKPDAIQIESKTNIKAMKNMRHYSD